jgi:signal transduction histidine kinase
MHDVLAHRITLLSLHAGALELRPDMEPGEVATVAGTMRATAHQALEDLREILGVLRHNGDAAAVRPQPGVASLAELVGECRAAGVPVELDDRLPEPERDALPSSVSRTAYRVVQEGLTNARKHAPGVPVGLEVTGRAGEGLRIEIVNPMPDPSPAPDGSAATAPAPAIPGAGAGLVGLRERVELVGGTLSRTTDGGRHRLTVWLPWAP